jgi:hypothetical protein
MITVYREERKCLDKTCRVSLSPALLKELESTIYNGKTGKQFIDVILELDKYPTLLRNTCPLNEHLVQLPKKITLELSPIEIGLPYLIEVVELGKPKVKVLKVSKVR